MDAVARPNRHAGEGAPGPSVPEPSFAEQARTLLHRGRTGSLATQARRQPGFPFASVAPYGLDAGGRPTFLFSNMAMHTQHLGADARASLLVTQPGWDGDPLAGARVTLIGTVAPVEGDALEPVRADYLGRHDNARYWVDFDDFAFFRMDVLDAYFVAGFGAMGWVDADAYGAAAPDPLADVAPDIIAHMNTDHADALVLYCRVFAGVAAESATMTAVDRLGFRVRARVDDGWRGVRIAFPREVRDAGAARVVLVEMVRQARSTVAEGQG